MFRLIPVWGAANKVAVNTREQVFAHVTFSLSVSSGHLEMFGGLLSLDLSDGAHCFLFRSRLQSQAAGTLLDTLTSFCGVCSPWALVFKLPPFLWISTEIRSPCCFLDVIDSSLNPQLSYAIEHFILFLQTIGAVCDAGHHVDKSIPVCFKVGVSLCNSGCPGTHPVERAGLQLKEPFRLCLPSAGMKGLCRSARQ